MGAAACWGNRPVSFATWSEFIAMGGHGLYVWLAYGVALIVVLFNVFSVRVARRRFFRQARALERRTSELDQR